MTKPNKDRELLVELKHVLGAMSSQEACRNRLRLYGVRVPTGVWPNEALADYWREKIQAHLGDGFDETRHAAVESNLCSDCPPADYPTDATRCGPCPRRRNTDGFAETRQQLEELGKASGGSHRQHIAGGDA